MTEKLNNVLNLPLEIKRHKKRRHLLLQVTHDAISVKAPYYSSKQEIIDFVNSHEQWIEKTYAKLPKRIGYQQGEKILHIGKEKILKIQKGPSQVKFDDEIINISFATTKPQAIAYLLKQAYIRQANLYLKERFDLLTESFPHKPRSLIIKDFKSRWGACDKEGHIQLSWRLIMSPTRAIDYVIIHELCHLKHFNHSKAFWSLVKHHHSTYQMDKSWLDKNQVAIKTTLM